MGTAFMGTAFHDILARSALTRRLRALAPAAVLLTAVLLTTVSGAVAPAVAQPVKGDVTVTTKDGYARIVVQLKQEVESTVKVAGGIVVVHFSEPVDAPIEKVTSGAPGYVGAARRDPDGTGMRIALARKVTVNSMAAGEWLFIDLLPENWTGVAPGLPNNVIEELARRAREAEKHMRLQRQISQRNQKPVRVRVGVQPTFTRFIFELPGIVPVSVDRGGEALVLTFGAGLKFDLAEAKTNMPAVVKTIESFADKDSATVKFAFADKADIRTFREENSYVLDIGASDDKDAARAPGSDDPAGLGIEPRSRAGAPAGVEAPATIPAKSEAARNPPPPAPLPVPAPARLRPAAAPPAAAPGAETPATDAPAQAAVQPVRADAKPHVPAAVPASDRRVSEAAPPAASAPPPAAAAVPPPAPAIAAAAPAASPPPVPAPAVAPAAPVAATPAGDPHRSVAMLSHVGDSMRLEFRFGEAIPAAAFRRADALWLVFDSTTPIDLTGIAEDKSGVIRGAQQIALPDGLAVRIALERPRLTSIAPEGTSWIVTLGDAIATPTRPLGILRNIAGAARATATVPIDQPRKLHRVADPDIGDSLLVVTALGPARGFLKTQDFIEFRVLASSQGVVVQPVADDVHVDLAADKAVIGRPNGLTLSGAAMADRNSAAFRPTVFDAQLWGFDRESKFTERQYKLIAAAADAGESKRFGPRMELARFYLAREMFVEAKGVLDLTLAEERPTADNPTGLVLRAIANIMLNRPEAALKDLADPLIRDQYDAPLWRAFAHARQGKWSEARAGFQDVAVSIATLPIELQQLALKEAMRAAIEVRDFAGAGDKLHEFETIGMPRRMQPAILVLSGRLAQGLGKNEEALRAFRAAAETEDRPAAAQGQLREIALRYGLGDLKRADVIAELETLTSLWRGDDTEVEALQLLGRLYTEEGRYRDAFHVMRTALRAHPNSEVTRRIQEEAAATFDSLFLAGKGDALPAIDALSLFYDFRELTPIGRRGDEMIRRLADRLVAVDLLYQASELLQHQIDNRLQGAARSQVATRLAVVYLMDRKPQKALAVLKATRLADLSNDLRQLRLLLEARALSDIGRHELALEVIADIERREAIRLRSDILWAAKRYGESAEQIELLYGERWKQFESLNDSERGDILRAAIGYALGEDSIGLGRLREKYAPKMQDGPNRRAFEIATAPFGANSAEFRDVAKLAATSDTLTTFLREVRTNYPEIGAQSAIDPEPASGPRAARRAGPADVMPTGSILPDRARMRP